MKFIVVLFSIFALFAAFAYGVEKSACLLPRETGPCRKSDLVHYYDSEAKECKTFYYGGCHGNENRFQTKEECEKTCVEQ